MNIKYPIYVILKKIDEYREERRRVSSMRGWDDNLSPFIIENSISELELNKIKEIQNFWKPLINYNISDNFYRIVNTTKHNHTTLPLYQYISESIMFPNIIRNLNPMDASRVLSNKGLYGIYFKNFKRPKEIIRNINGIIYNEEYQLVNKTNAIDIILKYKEPIIIKPIIDTYGGCGIKILQTYYFEDIVNIFDEYKNNFVIQALIKQSQQTKQFNPTSLNTFRIVTLFLNGNLSILSKTFRCGGKNAIVDNAYSGGVFVGIDKKGNLSNATSHNKLSLSHSPTRLKFEEYKIHHFDKVLNYALSLHQSLPLCAFAGWDIALDENDNPVLIEVNLNTPEICLLQILNGPIFGERFDEVIDYVFKRNNKLSYE